MCDQDHFDEDLEEYETRGLVTRRQFGVLLGAGVSMMLPQAANAVAVTEQDVTITTPDGTADAYFVHPTAGTAPGVLLWPDIFGLRPAFRQMGKRLAESGYSVLVVNPFYRVRKAPTAAQGSQTPIPELLPLAQALNETTTTTDAKAFIAWLDGQASVAKNRKIGTQGYCMSGPMAFRTSAAIPDRAALVLGPLGVADDATVADQVDVGLVHLVGLEHAEEEVVRLIDRDLRAHQAEHEPFAIGKVERPLEDAVDREAHARANCCAGTVVQ